MEVSRGSKCEGGVFVFVYNSAVQMKKGAVCKRVIWLCFIFKAELYNCFVIFKREPLGRFEFGAGEVRMDCKCDYT